MIMDPRPGAGTKQRLTPHMEGGETHGRSPSNNRICWTCDEVVTGNPYASTCPKLKKNKTEEQTKPITPYPGRGRNSLKEREGVSQGGETYRNLQGSFGSKSWSSAGAAAAAESAAADERNEARPGATPLFRRVWGSAGPRKSGRETGGGRAGEETRGKMNPKSFPNTRGALSEDEPEAVDMSIDSPDSPEEAGANARSLSPDPDYEPEEEADMLLDQAEAIEVKMDSPEYIAPGSRSPSIGRTPSPISALFHQVHKAGTNSHTTPGNLEESRKRREEGGRRRSRARLLLDQVRRGPESKEGGLSFKDPLALGRRSRAVSEEWV